LLRVGTANDAGGDAPKHVVTALETLGEVCDSEQLKTALDDDTRATLQKQAEYPNGLVPVVAYVSLLFI